MKQFYFPVLVFSLIISFPAYAGPTIEETVVTSAFGNFVIAEVYDDVCNQPKMIDGDVESPAFVNYFGNTQMIAARMGGLWRVHNPDATPEQGVQALLQMQETIKTKAHSVLTEKGCKSTEGESAKKAFDLYTQVHPSVLYGLIDQQIVKKGGTVTPPEKLDKPLPKK